MKLSDFFEKNWDANEVQGFSPDRSVSQYEPAIELHADQPQPLNFMKNFTYLIHCMRTKTGAIIDPQKEAHFQNSRLSKDLHTHKILITEILITHSHHDHITGLEEALSRFPNAKVRIHPKELHRLNPRWTNDSRVQRTTDNEVISLGDLHVTAMHTPGHSAGELCYFLKSTPEGASYLFSGDTLFIGDCGRTDFPDGSNQEMFSSLQRIKTLPAKTIILPGHHYRKRVASTLERELETNEPLKCKTVEELEMLP